MRSNPALDAHRSLELLKQGKLNAAASDELMAGDYQMWREPIEPAETLRKAAVLITIIKRDEPSILLTTRASHLKNHAGQISFPGGRWEASDCSLQHTALREASEEVALNPKTVSVLAQLPIYTTRTNFQISPYVGLVQPQDLSLQADPSEVADMFEVPLSFFLELDNFKVGEREFQGRKRQFWTVPFQDRYIWGATAAMLRNLSVLLNAAHTKAAR